MPLASGPPITRSGNPSDADTQSFGNGNFRTFLLLPGCALRRPPALLPTGARQASTSRQQRAA